MTNQDAPSAITFTPNTSVRECAGYRLMVVRCFEFCLGRRYDQAVNRMKGSVENIETLDLKGAATMGLQILRFRHHISHWPREDQIVLDEIG